MSTRRRPPDPTPDLFDNAALRHLSDAEIKRLGDAVVAELDRRGFGVPMPPAARYSAAPASKSPKAPAKSRVPTPAQLPLTAAKANAIKAALMAGLKPNVIARQFGVSLGDIREALTEMKRK